MFRRRRVIRRVRTNRQPDDEAASAANLAVNLNLALMRAHDCLDDRQPQTAAPAGSGPGFIYPVKTLKNPIQMFGVDPAAVIAYRQHQPTVLTPRLHADMLWLAVRQRIVQ